MRYSTNLTKIVLFTRSAKNNILMDKNVVNVIEKYEPMYSTIFNFNRSNLYTLLSSVFIALKTSQLKLLEQSPI